MKLYLDSNVLISLINHEFGKAFEYMEQAVQEFLVECGEKNHLLVLSNLFFKEVEKTTGLSKEKVMEYFDGISRVEAAAYGRPEHEKAAELFRTTKIHFPDSLHAAIAIQNKCDYIVTWNLKDFDCVQDIIGSATPRDFIRPCFLSRIPSQFLLFLHGI